MKVLSYESEDVQQPRRKVAPNLTISKSFFIFQAKLRHSPRLAQGAAPSVRIRCRGDGGGQRSDIFVCMRKEEIVNRKLISSFSFFLGFPFFNHLLPYGKPTAEDPQSKGQGLFVLFRR